ncbi:hypothetical protein H0H81_001223 [Sphagnurus paluster]|uniref:Uncharacterized protein n=1 Tax=Sphagnurus paluster TaxID=117069 RepID=A0A9P7FTC1_9AGAR|nr:hypothetical protein H0H81_001223 [Sphagnurus paluster]
MIFIIALSKIHSAEQRTMFSRAVMTVLVTSFIALSTSHYAAYWIHVRQAFMIRDGIGNPNVDSLKEYPDWYIGMVSVSDVNAIVADCFIIWRCWVVWGRSWKVVIIPTISTMLAAAFCVVETLSESTNLNTHGVDYATALYSTSLATTVYCTSFIVSRMLQVRYRAHPGSRGAKHYGAFEIFVESSAPYCAATLFVLVAYIRGGSVFEFASALWVSITGISPTLIVARVAAGNAQSSKSWDTQASPISILDLHKANDTISLHKRGESFPNDVDPFALCRKVKNSGEYGLGEKCV